MIGSVFDTSVFDRILYDEAAFDAMPVRMYRHSPELVFIIPPREIEFFNIEEEISFE